MENTISLDGSAPMAPYSGRHRDARTPYQGSCSTTLASSCGREIWVWGWLRRVGRPAMSREVMPGKSTRLSTGHKTHTHPPTHPPTHPHRHAHTDTHAQTRTHPPTHTHTHTHTHTRAHTHTHTRAHAHAHTHTRTRTPTHPHTHTHTHTHTPAHTHTHTHRRRHRHCVCVCTAGHYRADGRCRSSKFVRRGVPGCV